MTVEEAAQLMRKLQAAPHLLLLNLRENPSVGGQLHVCLPALTNLQVLSLNGTCARGLGLRIQGLVFGVWGLGFRVWGLGFGVWDFGIRVLGLGFRVWGLGFRV